MRSDIVPGAVFPDYELPDHTTTPMRLEAQKTGDVRRMQVWGWSIRRACAGGICLHHHRAGGWSEAQALLPKTVLIAVSLLRRSQTCCSSFSSERSGKKYIIAGNAIMTKASGV